MGYIDQPITILKAGSYFMKLSKLITSALIPILFVSGGLFYNTSAQAQFELGFTRCTYKHNGEVYALEIVFTRSCPDIDPPAEEDGTRHQIVGDLPPSHPDYNPNPDVHQKIDDHNCIIGIWGNQEG